MKVTDIKILKDGFGDTVSGPCKIANVLKTEFATLGNFNNLDRCRHDDQVKSPPITTTQNKFHFRYVTSKEVLDTLRKLNGNKLLSLSQVSGWELRDAAPCEQKPLNFIKNKAIETQSFPMISKKQKPGHF